MSVKEQRLKAGLSRAKLAKLVGVTQETIYKIEKDPERGRLLTFKKIAEALDCKIDDLI